MRDEIRHELKTILDTEGPHDENDLIEKVMSDLPRSSHSEIYSVIEDGIGTIFKKEGSTISLLHP